MYSCELQSHPPRRLRDGVGDCDDPGGLCPVGGWVRASAIMWCKSATAYSKCSLSRLPIANVNAPPRALPCTWAFRSESKGAGEEERGVVMHCWKR